MNTTTTTKYQENLIIDGTVYSGSPDELIAIKAEIEQQKIAKVGKIVDQYKTGVLGLVSDLLKKE